MLIDTHCHLDAAEFDADRDAVVASARESGVGMIVIPAVEYANFDAVLDACKRYPICVAALGMHPMYIHHHRPEHLQALREAIGKYQPVAVGEIGLDFFVPDLDQNIQEFYFVEQLKIAKEFDLPVLLHIRKANDQVLKQLRRFKLRGGIAHAFNGSVHQANEFIKLGFKLGFGGAMTYSRALNLRRLAAYLPLESIVLETDAPDIPPVWIGKNRNSPACLPQIAAEMAAVRQAGVEELIAATSRNVLELFQMNPAG
jgi:TatD DNase family protein